MAAERESTVGKESDGITQERLGGENVSGLALLIRTYFALGVGDTDNLRDTSHSDTTLTHDYPYS